MNDKLRVLFFASEFPYPPNHGGRADVWRRLEALAESGVAIYLICWYSNRRGGAPKPQDVDAVQAVVARLEVLPIDLSVTHMCWRVMHILRGIPSHASARIPSRIKFEGLLNSIVNFKPNVLWIDGLWCAEIGRRVGESIKLPYFYRSHNIEYRYMSGQAKLSNSLFLKLRLALTLIGLRKFEQSVVIGAEEVFDISMEDLEFWRKCGMKSGRWLPPFIGGGLGDIFPSAEARTWDVVFVGNLHTPNNVDGLLWFIDQVVPIVQRQFPAISILFAGSEPSGELISATKICENISVISNPKDVTRFYAGAHVLINPVRHSSGLNIKSVEMLHYSAHLVSTSAGVRGLPTDVKRLFSVGDSAAVFADFILDALGSPITAECLRARVTARRHFTFDSINPVVQSFALRIGSEDTIEG